MSCWKVKEHSASLHSETCSTYVFNSITRSHFVISVLFPLNAVHSQCQLSKLRLLFMMSPLFGDEVSMCLDDSYFKICKLYLGAATYFDLSSQQVFPHD